jgi:hypothetical protein
MISIDPKDLVGRTFLKETEEDGQLYLQSLTKRDNRIRS